MALVCDDCRQDVTGTVFHVCTEYLPSAPPTPENEMALVDLLDAASTLGGPPSASRNPESRFYVPEWAEKL